MKHSFMILAAALLLVGCKGTTEKNSASASAEASNAVGAEKVTYVKPLPAGIDLANLKDATVPAAFTTADFNWAEGKLTLTVYAEDLYDTVQLNQVKEGDTVQYGENAVVVKTIKNGNGGIVVNNGYEEGGAEYAAAEGGTYRAVTDDDHSLYTELGKVTLPLAKNFTIVDCGENPTDKSTTISADQKKYLDGVQEYKREFSCLNTKVEVQNGEITKITRVWIP